MEKDIVYFVKDTESNEELRYSLRTLKNFPHRKVWFYGGCPAGLKPDKWVHIVQDKENKWENVRMMLESACKNKEISSSFWLFNDDFFIMKKLYDPKTLYNGDLYKRIVQLEDKYERITTYSKQLREMCKELEAMGCPTRNYALHVPILIHKKKALEVLNLSDCPMFRSLYANYCNLGGVLSSDCKITSIEKTWKRGAYLSTDDDSFKGAVGKQIRELFPDKCQYEV